MLASCSKSQHVLHLQPFGCGSSVRVRQSCSGIQHEEKLGFTSLCQCFCGQFLHVQCCPLQEQCIVYSVVIPRQLALVDLHSAFFYSYFAPVRLYSTASSSSQFCEHLKPKTSALSMLHAGQSPGKSHGGNPPHLAAGLRGFFGDMT